MAANLNRKAVGLGTGQSQLNFGSNKKPEVIYIKREAELRALGFEAVVFVIEIKDMKQRCEKGVQTQVVDVEEVKEQQHIEKIKTFECQECQNFFSTESSLKRHLKEIHSGKAKVYFKHDKVDGRYQCTTCVKSYTHSAKVKKHMHKHHLSEFLIQDKDTQKLVPAKTKSNTLESQREQQEKLKRQKRMELMNQPAGRTFLVCFQERAMYIPALNAVDLNRCIENYLHIDVPAKAQLIVVDEYAYKVYPFSYLLKNEQYQNEFANEYMILRESQRRGCKNLLKLDGVILGHGFIALRLKKIEMTLREYLYQNSYPDDLNEILSEMTKGVKELHELGYVHRDLKPENVMLNICPLEIVVIDFNRAIRQEKVTLAKVLGTPGYFPIRQKWTNGSVQWDVRAVAAIILECDLESMSYFGTKHEKQSIIYAEKHIKQDEFCQEIKRIVERIIVRAPAYPRQSLDDMLEPLKTAKFKRYNKDKYIKFV